MLRLTRTAIGLLTAQYRSVLRKCWAINVGVFGLMGKAAASVAKGAADTIGGTLSAFGVNVMDGILLNLQDKNLVKLKTLPNALVAKGAELRSEILAFARMTGDDSFGLTKALPVAVVAATIAATVPTTAMAEESTGNAAIITDDGTSSDYNYIAYEDGTLVYKKVKFNKDNIHQSNKISWSDMATSGTVTEFPISYNTGTGIVTGTVKANLSYLDYRSVSDGYYTYHGYIPQDQYYTYTYTKPSDYTATNKAFTNNARNNSISDTVYYNISRAVTNNGTLTSVVADFVGNRGSYLGGAFINNAGAITTSIVGDFVGNGTDDYGSSYGAAIFNQGTITGITGDFSGNGTNGSGDNLKGGAIYNYGGYIGTIHGDFTGNNAGYLRSSSNYSNVYGGAIANLAVKDSSRPAKIDAIYGDFSGNSSQRGGAIANIGISSTVKSEIGTIVGDFVGNSGNDSAAILNQYGEITSISGDFIGNTGVSYSGNGGGNVILNRDGIIGSIIGDFIGNTATAIENTSYSGESEITLITGDFIGNRSASFSNSKGGAGVLLASNESTTTFVDSNFISNEGYSGYYDNVVSVGAMLLDGDSSDAPTVNIYAKTKDVQFYDNRRRSSNEIAYADVYFYNYGYGQLNLGAASDKSISFGGTIEGNKYSTLNLNTNTDSGYHGGSYNFYNMISGVTFNMGSSSQSEAFTVKLGSKKQSDGFTTYGSLNNVNLVNNAANAVLDTINGRVDTNTLNTLNLQQALKLNIDVQAVNGTGDKMTLTDSTTIGGTGNFVIDKINVLPQMYGVSVADDNIKGRVELSEALQNGDFSGVIGADVKSVEYDSETGMLYLEVPFGSSGGTWGSITGTITKQTDLMKHLNNNYYTNNKKSEILDRFEGWKTGNKITDSLSKCHVANDNFVSVENKVA